jgi:hypothetical protein
MLRLFAAMLAQLPVHFHHLSKLVTHLGNLKKIAAVDVDSKEVPD